MKRFARLSMPLLVILHCCFTCTTPPVAGTDPGGSEITNGLVAAMNGAPASGIIVAAYPNGYIAGNTGTTSIISDVTDSAGAFELAIDSGVYNVFIIDTNSGSGRFIRNVGPKTDLGTLRLDSLGSIAGTIRVDSAAQAARLFIYSRGTPFRGDIAYSDGTFRFDRVPAGVYELSIAKYPMVGCSPGEDCGPSGGTGGNGSLGVDVASGGTSVIDTVVNASDIGQLP